MTSRFAPLALVLIIGAALTGCAPAQSKSEACDIFSSADLALVDAITNSSGSLIDDPATARDDLDAAVTTFEKDVSKISNGDVKTAVDAMTAALKDFNSEFADAAKATEANPDSVDNSALNTSLSAAETAESDVARVCNSN
ncbi:hypothetical protein [Paramicrobacterium chengjingii]|uniref:Uncharacterized protein n=1 Tax=Paramicrobacterium chengjingii TaxID=2769067 RepID=A0ABX6YKB7_9MICO|nr:hypothetical protein [Microbacterium chengjingii]QPZ39223.1 hypothetical protein HCR76_03930 [Microbacterium chengjingii]